MSDIGSRHPGLLAGHCSFCSCPLVFGGPAVLDLPWVLCPFCADRQLVADAAASAIQLRIALRELDTLRGPSRNSSRKRAAAEALRGRIEDLADVFQARAE